MCPKRSHVVVGYLILRVELNWSVEDSTAGKMPVVRVDKREQVHIGKDGWYFWHIVPDAGDGVIASGKCWRPEAIFATPGVYGRINVSEKVLVGVETRENFRIRMDGWQ